MSVKNLKSENMITKYLILGNYIYLRQIEEKHTDDARWPTRCQYYIRELYVYKCVLVNILPAIITYLKTLHIRTGILLRKVLSGW